jgi:acyl dehydratase
MNAGSRIPIGSLASYVGREVGVSDWIEITQDRVTRFAEATGDDHQWIHVDPVRAASESPYRTTIAHGFLTLSLVSVMLRDAVTVDGVRLVVNYGVNRLRFVSPVPAGSRVRGRFTLAAVEEQENSVGVTWHATIERDGHDRPACVVEWLMRYELQPQ